MNSNGVLFEEFEIPEEKLTGLDLIKELEISKINMCYNSVSAPPYPSEQANL